MVITYTPPASDDNILNVFYSTDSGTTYYWPSADTCAADPRNGPWVTPVDSCTMTVTMESRSILGSPTLLQPGYPHTILLGGYTTIVPPQNSVTADWQSPPLTLTSDPSRLNGDLSENLPTFPTITSVFYGADNETIYFDNSQAANKWWGIAYSLDAGSTWITPENPSSNGFYCDRAEYAISLHFYSCNISGLNLDATIKLRYYVDSVGPDAQGNVDTSTFNWGNASSPITFRAATPVPDHAAYYIFDQTDGSISNQNGSVSIIPGDGSLNLNFASPAITTVGGTDAMQNVYYAYGITPYVQYGLGVTRDSADLWNLNPSDLKMVDGENFTSLTISKLPNGQQLTNGQSYSIALAYYVPGLSHFIWPAQIDNNGNSDLWNFVGSPVAVPPTIIQPSAGANLSGTVGTLFSESVTAAGGQSPYTYAVSGGMLPPGISMETSTGIFSGIPTAPGTFVSTLSVTSRTGGVSTVANISIYIAPIPIARPDNYYWIENDVSRPNWSSIASSADGSHLAAVTSDGYIYTSSNFGTAWTQQSSLPNSLGISIVTSSADGSRLAILVPEYGIWTSANYGVTWSQPDNTFNGIGNGAITALTSSSDGSHLAVTVDNGSIFTSSDYGSSWVAANTPPPSPWTSIVINSDGSHISAGTSDGYIWTTTNGGISWSNKFLAYQLNIHTIASDSSGTVLIAGTSGQCYYSSDSGTNWSPGGAYNATSILLSSDASRFSVIAGGALMSYTDFFADSIGLSSANSDFNFMQNSNSWSLLASNSDGSFLITAPVNGSIWSGPSAEFDATLTGGLIRGVPISDLGTPSQSLSTAASGSATVTVLASGLSILPTIFMPTIEGSVISRVVKYPSGGNITNFATDGVFSNQQISDGDFLAVEVTSALDTHLYYKFNITLAPINVLPDFNVASDQLITNAYFGPTLIGQSETQSVQLSIQYIPGVTQDSYLRSVPSFDLTNGSFTFDVSSCVGEDNPCSLPVTFTPTRAGEQYGAILVEHRHRNVDDWLVVRQYESILFKGIGLLVPESANPPLVWTSHTVQETQTWQSITSSADGSHLAAVVNGGDIFTSSDYGNSWTDRVVAGSRGWSAIDSSADGSFIVATDNDNYFNNRNTEGGYIYISSDYGVSWEPVSSLGNQLWSSIASSADGTHLVASAYGGHIYTSENSGVDWIDRGSPALALNNATSFYPSVATSLDGMHLAVPENGDADGGSLYTSADGGANWNLQTSAVEFWVAIASNSDGSRLVAIINANNSDQGDICTSSDFGLNWTHQAGAGNRHWTSVTSSLDGSHLAATASGGYIYLSEDFGVTWESQTVAGQNLWTSIASSASGDLLAATGTNIDIWTRKGSSPSVVAAPSASIVPTPQQQSSIISLSPAAFNEQSETVITISGNFSERVNSITINGNLIRSGSWAQSSSMITFAFPASSAGKYSIQLLNGSEPLLPAQIVNVEKVTKPTLPVVVTPTPSPKPETSTSGSGSTSKPLKSQLVLKVYFDLGSSDVKGENLKKLQALAASLASLGKSITITVTGYAQPTPKGASLDAALSKRRAAEVAKLLKADGVTTKVTYLGAGRAAVNAPSSRYVEIVAANR